MVRKDMLESLDKRVPERSTSRLLKQLAREKASKTGIFYIWSEVLEHEDGTQLSDDELVAYYRENVH